MTVIPPVLLLTARVFAFHPFSWLVSLSLHHYHRRFRQHVHHFRRHVSPTRLELRVCLIAEQCALRLNQPMQSRRSTERFESVDLSAKYLRKWKRLASHMMVKAWSMSQSAKLIVWLRWWQNVRLLYYRIFTSRTVLLFAHSVFSRVFPSHRFSSRHSICI